MAFGRGGPPVDNNNNNNNILHNFCFAQDLLHKLLPRSIFRNISSEVIIMCGMTRVDSIVCVEYCVEFR